MTKVTLKRISPDHFVIRLDGHANFVKEGPDILCAAISVAAQMAIVGLQEIAKADVEVFEDQTAGLMIINVLSMIDEPVVQSQIKTFETTIKILANQYPENIHVCSQ